MAIHNCMCEKCDHSTVCSIYKSKISVFSDDVKTPLGVDILIEKCDNYKEVEC